MKHLLYIIISVILFSSCHFEKDKIIKENNEFIYVQKTNMFNGEKKTLKYSQPKYHRGVIEHKRCHHKPRKRYIRVHADNRHLYIRGYDRYVYMKDISNLHIGDSVIVKETFYPYHKVELYKAI